VAGPSTQLPRGNATDRTVSVRVRRLGGRLHDSGGDRRRLPRSPLWSDPVRETRSRSVGRVYLWNV